MKKIFLILLTVIFLTMNYSCQSSPHQESSAPKPKSTAIKVSGKFHENYRTLSLSPQIQRLLFVATEGNLSVPETGFFFELSPQSAAELKMQHIIYIPNSSEENESYYSTSEQDVTLNVIKLTDKDESIFYEANSSDTNDNELRADFFKNPNTRDTLDWSSISDVNQINHVSDWINVLESTAIVTVRGTMYAALSDGTCRTSDVYDKMELGKIAKERLHSIEILFPETENEDWTQKDWRSWYEKTMNGESDGVNFCNTFQSIELNFKYGYENSALYATDEKTNKIFRLETVPNYEEFENQQLIAFDLNNQTQHTYKIFSKDYEYANSFAALAANNNSLFATTQYFRWYRYEFDAASNTYKIVQEIKLLPEEFYKGKIQSYPIEQTYSNLNKTFILMKKTDDGPLYLLSFDTQTGSNIKFISLEELATKSGLKSLKNYDVTHLHLANDLNGWYWSMAKKGENSNDEFLLLKTDANFSKLYQTSITRTQAYGWLVSNNAGTFLLDEMENEMRVVSFSESLIKTNQTKTFTMPYNWDDNFVQLNKDQTISVYEYEPNVYTESIVEHRFDATYDKEISKNCVISRIPLENASSDNLMNFAFVTSLNNKSFVFVKDGGEIRWTTSRK